jgi:glucose-6-phosphate 1-dehydrogenase
VIDGQPVAGYRGEEKVAPDSWTATFVVVRLEIDNWRWAGTPFYLRHGKRLPRRLTEIAIQFKRALQTFFLAPTAWSQTSSPSAPSPMKASARGSPPKPPVRRCSFTKST